MEGLLHGKKNRASAIICILASLTVPVLKSFCHVAQTYSMSTVMEASTCQ